VSIDEPADASAARRPRLTFVITTLGLGGAQQQVRSLVPRMLARGWDVDLVTLLDPRVAPTADPPEVPLTDLGMRRRASDVAAIPRLTRHLRRRRPVVVHAHMVHANLLARAVRPLAGVPVLVCTAHSPYEGGRAVDLAYRASDRLCDVTTNVSRHAARAFVERGAVPEARMRVQPNGLDVAAYGPRLDTNERAELLAQLRVPVDRFAWLSAGRLAPEKDLPTLLHAFRELVAERPRQHLVLAGEGAERPALEALVAELGLTDHTSFVGYRSDVIRLMRGFDAFVMSSAWEGLPIVLLEAGACRLPAVATAVGGTDEVLLEGRTGRLVPPAHPTALAAAMREIAGSSPHARAAMGEAARDHVARRYDLDRVADGWNALYGELLARRGRPLTAR
jgi:glycosyltransferase involved in cell wall biosynthesis